MGKFDQRGQKVTNQTNVSGNQYNAGRDIAHVEGDLVHGDKVAGDKIAGDKVAGNKNVSVAIVKELEGLLKQVQGAAQSGELDSDTAEDASHSLRKAAIEAGKPQPDKTKLLDHVENTKTLLEKAASISKSVGTLAAAAGATYAKIRGWF